MSNLIEFQERLLKDHTVTYSIETAELNPINKNLNKTELTESFELKEYTLRSLRGFITANSDNLISFGNLIEGKVIKDKVILSIIKEQE